MEELLAEHRREKKETQSRIQALKSTVPKGDKRRKKDVQEAIEQVERQLAEKHAKEIAALNAQLPSSPPPLSSSSCAIDAAPAEQAETDDVNNEEDEKEIEEKEGKPKMSRQQQRKLKKAAALQAQREAIEAEVANMPDQKQLEMIALLTKLQPLGYTIKEVRADGHCLFAAVAFLLSSHWVEQERRPPLDEIMALRANVVANHEQRRDEVLPFLMDETTGEMMNETQFKTYCDAMRTKPVWGGAPELKALSNVLRRSIKVYMADGEYSIEAEGVQKKTDEEPLRLSYHRHAWGLGEHYNAVIPS